LLNKCNNIYKKNTPVFLKGSVLESKKEYEKITVEDLIIKKPIATRILVIILIVAALSQLLASILLGVGMVPPMPVPTLP